jgi:putative holliday junction resolvase
LPPPCPACARLLGLDLGDQTIGVAVSDILRTVATSLLTIRRTSSPKMRHTLLAIAPNVTMAGLVLGLPRNMDGSEGPRCQSTRAFARNLARLTPLPIAFWDERLSPLRQKGHCSRRIRHESVAPR